MVVTWTTSGGQSNVVQNSTNLMDGFSNLSGPIWIPGSGSVTTNYTHTGAATNLPMQFYRIRRP